MLSCNIVLRPLVLPLPLGLTNVRVVWCRAEDGARQPDLREVCVCVFVTEGEEREQL